MCACVIVGMRWVFVPLFAIFVVLSRHRHSWEMFKSGLNFDLVLVLWGLLVVRGFLL